MAGEHPGADKQTRVLSYITPILTGIVVLVPLVVLVQWLSGFVQSVGSTLKWVPMAPMTAILLLLLGTVLLLQRQLKAGRILSGLIQAVSIFVLLVSSYLVFQYFTGSLSTDIEGFLTARITSTSGLIIGRMSPVTAILFALISISVFISTFQRRLILLADILSISVFVVALIILSGYWYEAPLFYGGTIIPVAIPTGIGFVLFSTAQLFNKPENLFYRFINSTSVTAQISRAIVPISILTLLIGGYLGQRLEKLVSPDAHPALAVGTTLTILAAIILVIYIVSRRIERDIAQKERAIKESEENFHRSISDSPLGIRIVTEDGELIYANKAILDAYGYNTVEELKTTPTKELYAPESYAEHQQRRELRKQSKPVPSNYEISIVRKDGSIRHLSVSRKEVTWNGKIQFQVVYQDITEHMKAEEGLKAAAKEWQTTFNSIVDPISIHDKDFKIVRVNEAFAEFLNIRPEELIGQTCYKLMHGTTEPVSNCPFQKTIENKLPAEAEFFEPHLGRYLDVTTSPIFNETGEVTACVHVTRDITGRKKMDEQLMVNDRLASIGQLASGIAHELNNPLTGVIGFSELLLEKDVPDDIKEDLITINREARRTASVVKGLLTFTRKQGIEKEPVDINRIIREVLQLRAYEQKVNNIDVKTLFDVNLPEINGNGAQLQQVFINLIVNAEQAMLEVHSRGALTITTERVGDTVRACFADDGPGIKPENMRRLFTPFFTTKEVGKGTGLGLSICHGIVTEHGGRVYAESKPGKGATFIVELPVNK